MAKKIIETVEYYDDWDGTELKGDNPPVRKVTLDGVTYELFLTSDNRKELEEMLTKIKMGTPTNATARNVPKGRLDKKDVRAWAQNDGRKNLTAQGIKIPGDRGPIHADVYKAYDAR